MYLPAVILHVNRPSNEWFYGGLCNEHIVGEHISKPVSLFKIKALWGEGVFVLTFRRMHHTERMCHQKFSFYHLHSFRRLRTNSLLKKKKAALCWCRNNKHQCNVVKHPQEREKSCNCVCLLMSAHLNHVNKELKNPDDFPLQGSWTFL